MKENLYYDQQKTKKKQSIDRKFARGRIGQLISNNHKIQTES